jgi:Putative transposase/Transposase zinc-binding domain
VRHGPHYLDAFGARMPEWHTRALVRLMACRTFDAGRVYYECDHCGDWQVMAASCGHRACAQCGHHKAALWEAKQRLKLLPTVPYFMVTLTVPSEFRDLFKRNQLTCYNLLFTEGVGTVQEMARDPKHLGGEIGVTAVLHTWKRDLGYHPHIHLIVPGGALGDKGWIGLKKSSYLLPVKALAERMRNRMRERLRDDHPELWKAVPSGAWAKRWNVNIQFVGTGEKAFGYLARYVQSTAIRNKRIVACDDKTVTYEWVDRSSNQTIQQKVTGQEFLRRFLQHTLPKGLMRVRHYGFLSAAGRGQLASVRASLGISSTASVASATPVIFPGLGVASAGTPVHDGEASSSSRACCAGCRKDMTFREFRTSREPEDPPDLQPEKEVNRVPARDPTHRPPSWRKSPPPARGPPLVAERVTRPARDQPASKPSSTP